MPVKTSTKKEKKGGKGLAVAVIIILVLVVAAIAVWLLIKNDKIHLPSSLGKTDEDTTSEEMIDGENEDENEDESATDDATETDEAEVEELIADADDAVESAKSMLDDDSQVVDAMSQIRSAMDEYLEKSSEVGYSSVIEEHINDAYGTYVNGMSRRVDYMSTQTLSGGIYSQLMSEINDVIGYADTISAAGYSIDTTEITTLRDTFDTDYRTKIIETFNEFSTRDAWSRTEAWNLMSETDSMFDADDFDNPIKLRYEYALAYWTQKQIETDLASGTITAKGAAVKIGNILEATDYNLMLIYEYINFMDEAGEDYSAVSDAYYEALYQIYDTQGIDLTSDIDIYKFWSFNSFDDYSSSVGDGDVNGLTNENRTYIRELFQGVSFVN
jgi:hypothetical protein